jgi:transposase
MTWFALSVRGASAYANLKRMVSGADGIKLGDAKILRNDRIRTGPTGQRSCLWEAALCYTSPPVARVIGDAVVAVHRGMHQMLTLASTNGTVWSFPGDSYLAAKLGFSARRRSLLAHIRRGELGHGARGRGVSRRYKALDNLGDAEARMIKCACQQAAARVVEFARREGAGTIVLEDYHTIAPDVDDEAAARFLPKWPWAKLKAAVEWAARKGEARASQEMTRALGPSAVQRWADAALNVDETEAAFISLKCPNDGTIDAKNVSGRMFECVSCGLRRNTDTIAAFNMLHAYGLGDGPRQRFEKVLAAFAQSVKDAAE